MTGGWIKLHRKFSEWEWYQDSKMVHLFIHILINANHEENNWQGIEIKRGQILTSYDSLNRQTKISIRSLRTCLNKLKTTNEIAIKTTSQYSIITICNYATYQSIINETDTQNDIQTDKRPTSDRQATDKRSDNKQEYKNIKNEKKLRNKEEEMKIIYPWDNEKFMEAWKLWKQYKKEQHNFSYKPIGEQGALKDLSELSKNNMEIGIAIIYQSIKKGWKGFFELKNKQSDYIDYAKELIKSMTNGQNS